MVNDSSNSTVFVWEQPVLVKPEFRLYYDSNGAVICYTCERLPGEYVVIDAQTYAEGRHDVKVIDGKIINNYSTAVIARISKDTEGTMCAAEDMSIIIDKNEDGVEAKYWKLKIYELE